MTIGLYSVIYADPPWRYQRSSVQGAAEKHYPTMGIDELCALPVADLAAPDSVLFLWATFPQLPEALRLIKAWAFNISPWLSSGSNKTASLRAGFTAWAFGRGATLKFACWQPGGTRNATRPTSTSLLFPLYRSTAKSRRRPVQRSWPLWAMCPGWNCSPGSPRPAGTCGGMRWKVPCPTSGHFVQRWAGRKGVIKNSLCKCSQRFVKGQDQTCL